VRAFVSYNEKERTPFTDQVQPINEGEKREKPSMKSIKNEGEFESLRRAGWTTTEIEHLYRFRQHYQKRERRPAFVRGLLSLLQEGLPLPAHGHDEALSSSRSVRWFWPGR